MDHVAYSFDPRGSRDDEDVRAEVRSRYLSPDRLKASRQFEDGVVEQNRQVADIMAQTRPLRLRA